jgi:hypothetical protein
MEQARRAAVDWPLGHELIDQSDTQAAWFDYRTDLIHELVPSDRQSWDHFVLARLDESLSVTCPTYGAELPGLWLRASLGCLSCHHRFPIHQSPTVLIEDAVGDTGARTWQMANGPAADGPGPTSALGGEPPF